jgi:hypothetical protein
LFTVDRIRYVLFSSSPFSFLLLLRYQVTQPRLHHSIVLRRRVVPRLVYHIVLLELAKPVTYGWWANAQLIRDVHLRELLSRRFPHCDQATERMLVQTIVLSRRIEQPLQIASVHGSDVVLGPCGYPIIDDGCESAVGLVGEPAAEVIIIIGIITGIIIVTITMGSITFGIMIMITIITMGSIIAITIIDGITGITGITDITIFIIITMGRIIITMGSITTVIDFGIFIVVGIFL